VAGLVRLAILAAQDKASRRVLLETLKLLQTQHKDVTVRQDLEGASPEIVVALGDNRFLLDSLQDIPPGAAVLTVGQGFLAELAPEGLAAALPKVLAGKVTVEERLRLEVTIDGRHLPPALNEVALTSSRGGGFLRYSLEIDGERVWRDAGDGVVV
jgi:NAD kinase